MNYNKFKTQFVKRFKEDIGASKKIKLKTVNVSGEKHDVLLVTEERKKETDCIVRNELDLTDIYKAMQESGSSLDVIYVMLLEDFIRTEQKGASIKNVLAGSIEDFKNGKEHIASKLLLKKWCNEKSLKGMPHKGFLDMERIFVLMHGGVVNVISNELAEKWGVTEDELLKAANENIPEPTLQDIETFSLDDMEEGEVMLNGRAILDKDTIDIKPLYVLTGDPKMLGASCIAKPGVVKDAAGKLQSDLYVAPIVPTYSIVQPAVHGMMDDEIDKLNVLIKEINKQMSVDERITDHAYFYSRKKGWLA